MPHIQSASERDLRARADGGIEIHTEPISAMGTWTQMPAIPVPDSGRLLWGNESSYVSLLCFAAFA